VDVPNTLTDTICHRFGVDFDHPDLDVVSPLAICLCRNLRVSKTGADVAYGQPSGYNERARGVAAAPVQTAIPYAK
jgi:hypothetical protein